MALPHRLIAIWVIMFDSRLPLPKPNLLKPEPI
jgi:hypothetical protein